MGQATQQNDMGMTPTTPIPFITLSDDSTFEIGSEAIAYLQQIKGPIAVVSIAGLYRTGKSYLLNLLLGRDRVEAMFDVGATVNACTKGIWIWGQPVTLPTGTSMGDDVVFKHLPKDATIVFMDTEGLGSTQRSQTQDTRIFALALLLSSLFIYNSRGVIDSNAIEDLSLVVHLTKYIQTKATQTEKDSNDGSDLAAFFPDFLWVVRDFTLQLQEDGRKITPREYLEGALKLQSPTTDEIVQKNHIRTLLATFFPARDCVTMVRPLNDETLLRDLLNQSFETLRPEFRGQLETLKRKVFTTLKTKKMMANVLNGSMLISLAQNYVSAFNAGTSPVISTVWDRVLESECDQALDAAKEVFSGHFQQQLTKKTSPVMVNHSMKPRPVEDDDLCEIYAQARELAEKELTREDIATSSLFEEYCVRLSDFMVGFLQEWFRKNDTASDEFNKALLQELYMPNDKYLSDPTIAMDGGVQYLQDQLSNSRQHLEEIITKYHERSIGPRKAGALFDFLVAKLTSGLQDWGVAVKVAFRANESQIEAQLGSLRQELRILEGKVRAAQNVLIQENDSFERAVQAITERTIDERAILSGEIQSKKAEIDRAHMQIERMVALHKEALERLEVQLNEAKEERQKAEQAARDAEARREQERLDSNRQLLENERNFHLEEKNLMRTHHELMQKVVDLERQVGEQETESMKEIFRLEKERNHQGAQLALQYQEEQDELKEQSIQQIRTLKEKQDEDLDALQGELNDKIALLSSLQEQLAAKEAIKMAKANSFLGNGQDCVVQ